LQKYSKSFAKYSKSFAKYSKSFAKYSKSFAKYSKSYKNEINFDEIAKREYIYNDKGEIIGIKDDRC